MRISRILDFYSHQYTYLNYRYEALSATDMYVPQRRVYIPILHRADIFQNKQVLFWKLIIQYSYRFSYKRLYASLLYNSIQHADKYERDDLIMCAGRGVIFDDNFEQIHFLITINQEATREFEYAGFRIYMSSEFVEPKGRFKLIYRKFKKDFLDEITQRGADILITADIKSLFTDKVQPLQYDSFESQLEGLKEIPQLLY